VRVKIEFLFIMTISNTDVKLENHNILKLSVIRPLFESDNTLNRVSPYDDEAHALAMTRKTSLTPLVVGQRLRRLPIVEHSIDVLIVAKHALSR
jgi:hypothetical protein